MTFFVDIDVLVGQFDVNTRQKALASLHGRINSLFELLGQISYRARSPYQTVQCGERAVSQRQPHHQSCDCGQKQKSINLPKMLHNSLQSLEHVSHAP